MFYNPFLITKIRARQILDSRANPTVEADVFLSGGAVGRAAVPSGASTGEFEAKELRDRDTSCYMGCSVLNAVNNVNTKICDALTGKDARRQAELDKIKNELDGSENKEKALTAAGVYCAESTKHIVQIQLKLKSEGKL